METLRFTRMSDLFGGQYHATDSYGNSYSAYRIEPGWLGSACSAAGECLKTIDWTDFAVHSDEMLDALQRVADNQAPVDFEELLA